MELGGSYEGYEFVRKRCISQNDPTLRFLQSQPFCRGRNHSASRGYTARCRRDAAAKHGHRMLTTDLVADFGYESGRITDVNRHGRPYDLESSGYVEF